MILRAVALTALAFVLPVQAADAMVLSCLPEGPKGVRNNEAFLDAHVPGDYPPSKLESVSAIVRMGEDVYDYYAQHTKTAEFRGDTLHIHLLQPLSAGESAEVRFEGKIGAKQGEPFTMKMFIRNERRSVEASVRCTIE